MPRVQRIRYGAWWNPTDIMYRALPTSVSTKIMPTALHDQWMSEAEARGQAAVFQRDWGANATAARTRIRAAHIDNMRHLRERFQTDLVEEERRYREALAGIAGKQYPQNMPR